MDNSSEENKAEEVVIKKKIPVKNVDVDAAAKLLTDMEQENNRIKSENVTLKKIIVKLKKDLEPLRAEITKLKVVGAKDSIEGTGSTVHQKDE